MVSTQLIASLAVLSIAGIADSTYLAWKHTRKQPLVCPLNHTCDVVTESSWSKILGIRNEFLGVLYYVFMLAGAFALFFYNFQRLPIILITASGSAFLFSIFLVYLQAKAIKNYCFYCLISAGINLLIFLNIPLLI